MYSAGEIAALLIMQDLINQLQPGLLDEHLGPLRERLRLLFGREDLRSEEVRKRIRLLHMASRPVEPPFFSKVSQATLSRRRMEIECFTRSEDIVTQREISPQRLVFYRGNWYLDAWCHLRQDLRSFAIDAIPKVSVTDTAAREVDTAALELHLGAGNPPATPGNNATFGLQWLMARSTSEAAPAFPAPTSTTTTSHIRPS